MFDSVLSKLENNLIPKRSGEAVSGSFKKVSTSVELPLTVSIRKQYMFSNGGDKEGCPMHA